MVVTGDENYTTSYTYDANGNTLTVSTPANGETEAVTKTYTYNRFNQQIGLLTNNLPTAQYTYNAQGIRTSKTVGESQTKYLLDGGNVVAEIQGDATVSYLRGVNLISKTTDTTEYYLFNAHGDVVNLTNNTDTITKTYDYDAFGNERNPDEADENPFRYCGEYWDAETGTYYLRARYYDPAIGRFTQADTHWNTSNMIYGDNPQKINEREDKLGLKSYSYAPQISAIMQAGNLYVYCQGDPVSHLDKWGAAATRGQIHNWVVEDIVRRYRYMPIISNKQIDYFTGKHGFADLLAPRTGEVWEVKRWTILTTVADKQLQKYIAGEIHDKDVLVQYGKRQLILGGEGGTRIASNRIIQVYDGEVYIIYYFDICDGIILYNYVRWKYDTVAPKSEAKTHMQKETNYERAKNNNAAAIGVGVAAVAVTYAVVKIAAGVGQKLGGTVFAFA